MLTRFSTVVLLGFVLAGVAACGGGSDQTKIDQLETDLAASEEARKEAQEEAAAAKKKAEEEAAAAAEAAAAKQKAEAEAAAAEAAKKEAEEEAAAAKQKAEAEAAAAEAAKQKAEEEAAAAAAAEAARKAAEAAKKAAEEEAAAAKKKAEAEAAAAAAAEAAKRAADQAAKEAADKAKQAAEEQIRKQNQTLVASQRAERLSTVLGGISGFGSDLPSASVVTVTVPQKGRLTLKSGGKTATLAGAGLRSTTFALTHGGNPVKRVVYTDRELNRELLAHYGNSLDSGNKTRLDISDDDLGTGVQLSPATISEISKTWDITHGRKASLAVVEEFWDHDSNENTAKVARYRRPENPDPVSKSQYTGKLHGVSGNFVCGGDACQIQLTPTYEESARAGELTDAQNNAYTKGKSFDLLSVTLANVGGSGLYFKPSSSSATISLYEGGPVGTDDQYMVFGYWLEVPKSEVATPEFGVFAEAINENSPQNLPSTIKASYDGTAVGVYAEKDPNEALDTWRQGEFTAAAYLTVDGAPGTITGTVRNFTTTPVGGSSQPVTQGRWVVSLNASNEVALQWLVGTSAASGDGTWNHSYVQAHKTAESDVPPAVVGAFEAEIDSLLHIVGAFGAHKQ